LKSNFTTHLHLNHVKKVNQSIPAIIKDQVWNTWIGEEIGKTKCPLCQHNEIRQSRFHCAHVTAKSKGGRNLIENLRPICSTCNHSMANHNLVDCAVEYFPKQTV
jgi:5-methylcytosine-specific restriction endonuclease McrA